MIRSIPVVLLILIALSLSGCLSAKQQLSPALIKQDLTKDYYEKAIELENKNKLIQAKKYYTLAITADPLNQKAGQQLKRLNTSLKKLAQKYYQKSQSLNKKGKYDLSTRFLRMTLRYWPEHEKAREELIYGQQVSAQRYVWHTIKKGESLSSISKAYYGSTSLASTLAKVNQIKDAAKIALGMKLKIPQLKANPFINQEATMPMPYEKSSLPQKNILPKVEAEPEVNPIAMYKSLGIKFFDSKKFKSAIVEFKKILNTNPDDKDAVVYLRNSYIHLGTAAINNQQYLTAINYFQRAANHDKTCISCKNEIKNSQNLYKEFHYKTGMKLFDEENLSRAITQWDLVFEMDPDYKRISELLDKAKTIQKNINAIKLSQ
ncbi:MAG: LysM peptidoglycan-binding domain-containing protein [Desulfobacula sp.]|nr:LysM peptidoglycan-binding domain-containing protein [Desulfobacula sp.]